MLRKEIDDEESLSDDQKQKLKKFHQDCWGQIQEWRKTHAYQKLPIYWDDKELLWFWGDRAYRRMLAKRNRNRAVGKHKGKKI